MTENRRLYPTGPASQRALVVAVDVQNPQFLLAQSRDNAAEAESAFKEAIALAFAQSCRAIELRASVSLAMLFGESGRRADARDLLMPVYSSFTEGLDGVDLRAAKQLLEQLN